MLPRRESRVHWVLPSLVHLRALQCSLTCPFPLRALGFLLLFFFGLFARSPSPSTSPSLSSRSPPPSSPPFFLPALLLLGAKIGSSFSLAVRFQVNRRSIPAVSFQRLMKGDARKKLPTCCHNCLHHPQKKRLNPGTEILSGSWNHVARVPGALAAPIYFPCVFIRAACARASFWAGTKKIP